ncbi:hypothetical protein BDR05DRAFT_885721 [Suillus weaverae]|nr:hypothetical protein BDR05DRAFT_885721 [Suillus weaverae]
MTPYLDKESYHTSILSGFAWVQELLNGHLERIKNELGMWKHVFLALVQELWNSGLDDSNLSCLKNKSGGSRKWAAAAWKTLILKFIPSPASDLWAARNLIRLEV